MQSVHREHFVTLMDTLCSPCAPALLIVWHDLIPLLSAFITLSHIRRIGVTAIQAMQPEIEFVDDAGARRVIWVVPADMRVVAVAAAQARNAIRLARCAPSHAQRHALLFFGRGRDAACDSLIRAAGLWNLIDVCDFRWPLFQIDRHLFVTPPPHPSPTDIAPLPTVDPVGAALAHYCSFCGGFGRVQRYGPRARRVQIESLYGRAESSPTGRDAAAPTLVLFDRACDRVTPLLAPMTYEASVRRMFRVAGGMVHVGAASYPFGHASDIVFDQVRDVHVSQLGTLLGTMIEDIDAKCRAFAALPRPTPVQMRDMVREMPHILKTKAALDAHVNVGMALMRCLTEEPIAKEAAEFERALIAGENADAAIIDHAIRDRAPIAEVLRLLALYAHKAPRSMDSSQMQTWRDIIAETYGAHGACAFHEAQNEGMFTRGRCTPIADIVAADVGAGHRIVVAFLGGAYSPTERDQLRRLCDAATPNGHCHIISVPYHGS